MLGHAQFPAVHTRASVHWPSVQHGLPRLSVLIVGQELVTAHQAPAMQGRAAMLAELLGGQSTTNGSRSCARVPKERMLAALVFQAEAHRYCKLCTSSQCR